MATNRINMTPIGITLPIQHGNNGYFQQSFDTNTQIKNCLLNFLNTRRGERRMNPTFGTSLYGVVFEMNDDSTDEILKDVITNELNSWIPQISIKNISIKNKDYSSNTDNYIKKITINYMNNYTKQSDTLSLIIENISI